MGTPQSENGDDGQQDTSRRLTESNRVEGFSDGVFAIALTLLVLDLHAPAPGGAGFAHQLLDEWPAYVAYLAAFLNISAIWINHHDLFSRVARVDIRLICFNLGLLLVSSLFPWPASVISAAVRDGSHADQVAAAVLYAAVGFCVPIAWIALYRYLQRTPRLLLDAGEVGYMGNGVRRSMVSLVVYPVSAVVALVAPAAALALFVALPLFFIATLVYAPPRRFS
jgi:uncharacterized membrane protein